MFFFLSKQDNTVQQDYYELLWVALFCLLQIFCCKLELHATVKLFPKKTKKNLMATFFWLGSSLFVLFLRCCDGNFGETWHLCLRAIASCSLLWLFFFFLWDSYLQWDFFWQKKTKKNLILHLLSVSLVIFVSDTLSVHFNECTEFIFSYTPVLHNALLIVSVLFWHAVQCRFENNHG